VLCFLWKRALIEGSELCQVLLLQKEALFELKQIRPRQYTKTEGQNIFFLSPETGISGSFFLTSVLQVVICRSNTVIFKVLNQIPYFAGLKIVLHFPTFEFGAAVTGTVIARSRAQGSRETITGTGAVIEDTAHPGFRRTAAAVRGAMPAGGCGPARASNTMPEIRGRWGRLDPLYFPA
jgi:hypothetical protein